MSEIADVIVIDDDGSRSSRTFAMQEADDRRSCAVRLRGAAADRDRAGRADGGHGVRPWTSSRRPNAGRCFAPIPEV